MISIGKSITNLARKIDSLAPQPYYVDGVKQVPLSQQVAFLLGMVIGLIIAYLIF